MMVEVRMFIIFFIDGIGSWIIKACGISGSTVKDLTFSSA